VVRFINNAGYDTVGTIPQAQIGAGNVGVQGITTIPGIGSNSTGAQNLLLDLSGTLSNASQVLNSPGGPNPQFIPGETRYSNLLSHEYSGFFKDDWKVTPSLTLNLGVRYEYYGVPVDGDGRMQTLLGGGGGIFGISGTTFGSLFNPGATGGSLTSVQLIGPETPNPNTQLFNSSPHNFGPAVGFAWSLPESGPKWLTGGKDKTVIRSGYGISYIRTQLYTYHMYNSYEPDALTTTVTESTSSLLTLSDVKFPIPTTVTPLFTEPLNGLRSQSVYSFQNNLTTPYAQNFNFSIQRELTPTTYLRIAYVGDVGDRLLRAYDVNEVNLLGQGSDGETFLQAFETVRAGGDSKFMDQLVAPLGLTSALLRAGSPLSSIFQPMFANNNPAELAIALSASLQGSSLGSLVSPSAPGGALLTKAGLPQNFFVVNPQFGIFPLGTSAVFPGGAYTVDNSGHSDYHSLQLELARRLSHGFSYQASYVWSKVIGDSSSGESAVYFADFRTLHDEGLDKQVLSFNHAGVVKINGIYELPFGPGKPLVSNPNRFVSHLIGGWQMGAIFTYFTGAPLTLTGTNGFNNSDANGVAGVAGVVMQSTATQVGPLPTGITKVGNGVVYFPGTSLITDPQVATLASNLQALSVLKAVAINGSPVLVNATPGSLGALGDSTVNGPSGIRLDFNLLKRFKITERFVMEFRATAQNLTNTEVFGAPNTNINSSTFGHITATATNFGPRVIVAQLRLSF